MPSSPRSRLAINWDLLRHETRLVLARQPGWLAIGLGGHLLVALYTMFRPWFAARGERDLLQAALLFAAWNMLFGIVYVCAAWLRPRQAETEREQLHLPLSATHFALRRLVHTSAVPLAAALLALPLFAVLLLYYQVPYGVDGQLETWSWGGSGGTVPNPWWPRIGWIGGGILSAALLPPAAAAWLDALTPLRYLRCVLLLGLTTGMYFAVRLAAGWDYATQAYWNWGSDYGPMVMNYRQTRGVSPWPYLTLLALALLLPVVYGWLRPAWRWAVLVVPVLTLGALMLRKALPEQVRAVFRPVSSALFNRDARYAAGLFVGHLSAPKDMRMILNSYTSNVLFAAPGQPVEPDYPDYHDDGPEPERSAFKTDAEYAAALQAYTAQVEAAQHIRDAQMAAYNTAQRAYEAAQAKAPRLALWVMAGLYPLLMPLWAVAGLILGVRLRGEAAREG